MRLILTAILLSSSVLQAEHLKKEPQLLTEAEVFELVVAREQAKEKKKADFKALLKSERAIEEYSFYKDGRRILHRRLQLPQKKSSTPVKPKLKKAKEVYIFFSSKDN